MCAVTVLRTESCRVVRILVRMLITKARPTPFLLIGLAMTQNMRKHTHMHTRIQNMRKHTRIQNMRKHMLTHKTLPPVDSHKRNTTINAMSQMAQLSTRLVADAWHTAWMFAHQNVTAAKSEETAAGPMLLRRPSPSPAASLAAWNAAVAKAAEYDRREPSFHRTFLDIEMGKETPNKPTIVRSQ